LQSLVDKYPLYSRADEALYFLGQNYEAQIQRIRSAPTCDEHGMPRGCTNEAGKAKYIGELTKEASAQYSKIITRYPLMDRYDDARKRLTALHQPIPRPTKAAVAQNKAEIASRSEATAMQKMMELLKKGPDVARAAQIGEPSLVDPEVVSATSVVSREARGAAGLPESGSGEKSVGVEVITKPGSDLPPAGDTTTPGGTPFATTTSGTPTPPTPPTGPDPNELKPNAPADPNELKPADTGSDQPLPPPTQVNEIPQGASSSAANGKADDSTPASDEEISSSKKHKKRGLEKINPF
jgi:outer membrane protein assembly factor BamD